MFKKVKGVIHRELTNGLNLRRGSIAIASSFTLGIFPIIGFSTPLNTLSAFLFRLNQPIVQALNWVLGPLKWLLIIPFLRFGEWLFAAEPFMLSLSEFSKIFFDDWIATTREFAWTFIHVISGWLVLAPVIYLLVYYLSITVLSKRVSPQGTESLTRKKEEHGPAA
ncbi:hypothetical protein DDZ13_04380 [Coraliomargarita sinensis]|uniref:DUF2062 domain-containing protein n=1 Tax=Coraliomargarita sinensis TaxID=2174842 RepID=A0A317ZHL5_9BACT|nr:DUF2062 domain-containing protein [Coraliomargarita sinensis]PXA05204.1 hypothetical protein DDZ13_04380 [Coraliomargarita sinensis]